MSNALPKTQADLIQLFEPVRADLEAVEREYERQVQSQVPVIPEIGAYIQKSGGKRVRPAVLLMAARLCGYTGPRAVLNAAVVEFIHTATLVHDDIIDDADVRRGRKAVHSQWGNDVTVLAGDFLYIKSMAMALTQDTLDIVRMLCDVTLRMIEGEIYQLTKNGVVDLAEAEHFEIIHRKTAYLFGGCAEIGGMLGEVNAEKRQALREYGFNLGVMFQLVTTCSTSPVRPRRSASRLAATFAKARSRCRSSTCCTTAGRRRTRWCGASCSRATSRPSSGRASRRCSPSTARSTTPTAAPWSSARRPSASCGCFRRRPSARR